MTDYREHDEIENDELKNEKIDEKFLSNIEILDCIFPEVDYSIYR